MSQTPDKLREPIADLPNPELNPLLNPVLGRHLGQWAHVYFTTAPEKREEALFELIEDLKAEEARHGGPMPTEPAITSDGIYAIVCPRCERSNLRSQKYCGMCGALMPVRAQAAAASGAGGGLTFGSAMFEQDDATTGESVDPAVDLEPGLELMEPRNRIQLQEDTELQVDTESQSPFAATSLLFQSASENAHHQTPVRTRQAMPEMQSELVDIDWLRQKNFPSQPDSSSGIRSYLLGIAVVICIGILVFLLAIRPSSGTGDVAKQKPPVNSNLGQNSPTPLSTVEPSNSAAASTPSPSASVPQTDIPLATDPSHAAKPDGSSAIAHGLASSERSAPRNRPSDNSAAASLDADQSGAIEVAAAKQYLSGTNGHPDGATAAEILWKAVGKGNSSALVMLSDLYASGNGVPKNCDQARLLLQAALRRNVAGAGEKIQALQKSCP